PSRRSARPANSGVNIRRVSPPSTNATSSPPGSSTPSPPHGKNSNNASPTTTTPTHHPTPNHHRSDTRHHLLFCLVSGYAQWCAHVGTRITREGPAWQSCCHAGPPRAHLQRLQRDHLNGDSHRLGTVRDGPRPARRSEGTGARVERERAAQAPW